jgi:hypothetical protein
VIASPYNDHECLGAITDRVAEQLRQGDEYLLEIARQHSSPASLAAWIRGLPQRDDNGDPNDGPKVASCTPLQRLRVPTHDPNCVERSALYLGVAELLDSQPVRQLATFNTSAGAHTLPLENGAPVILDPSVPRNAVYAALAEMDEEPMPTSPRDMAEWTAQLAEVEAAQVRNTGTCGGDHASGPFIRQARDSMMRVLDGKAPTSREEVERIARMLSLAEQAAERYGARAMAIVRATVQLVSDLADETIARARQKAAAEPPRNLSLDIGGLRLRPAPWTAGLVKVAGRVGVRAGAMAARVKLASLGIPPDLITLMEDELRSAGVDLGPPAPVASPGRWAASSSSPPSLTPPSSNVR